MLDHLLFITSIQLTIKRELNGLIDESIDTHHADTSSIIKEALVHTLDYLKPEI